MLALEGIAAPASRNTDIGGWVPARARFAHLAGTTRCSSRLRNPSAMLPRSPDQILARFRRAEGRMGRQRDIRQVCQRVIHRQLLDVEDVETGMPDMAGPESID